MAASSVFGPSRARRIALDLRYALFALVYIAMLSWLSSHPEPKAPGSGALAQLAINLYHLPLYAGLGFFVLEAISRGQGMASHRWTRAGVTIVVTGVIAALDEWHQRYVPGRDPSFSDLFLDLAGVACLLLACGLGTPRESRR